MQGDKTNKIVPSSQVYCYRNIIIIQQLKDRNDDRKRIMCTLTDEILLTATQGTEENKQVDTKSNHVEETKEQARRTWNRK